MWKTLHRSPFNFLHHYAVKQNYLQCLVVSDGLEHGGQVSYSLPLHFLCWPRASACTQSLCLNHLATLQLTKQVQILRTHRQTQLLTHLQGCQLLKLKVIKGYIILIPAHRFRWLLWRVNSHWENTQCQLSMCQFDKRRSKCQGVGHHLAKISNPKWFTSYQYLSFRPNMVFNNMLKAFIITLWQSCPNPYGNWWKILFICCWILEEHLWWS